LQYTFVAMSLAIFRSRKMCSVTVIGGLHRVL
jgi:hypothetical protein